MRSTTLSRLADDFRISSPAFRHAVRAALAITAAIAAARALAFEHAVWIPISVIVVLRPSLGGTLSISWKRFSGTVIGAAAGILLASLHLSTTAVAALVMLFLFFSFYLKENHFFAFTIAVTLTLVLILGTVFSYTWQGGAERILDTFLGTILGIGASFLVWPNFARKHLRKEMTGVIVSQKAHFRQLRTAYFSDAEASVPLLAGRLKAAGQLESCIQKFTDAGVEPGLNSAQRRELLNLAGIFTRIHRSLISLSAIVNRSTGVFRGHARDHLDTLMDTVDEQFHDLADYAGQGTRPLAGPDFSAAFEAFMVYIGQERARGEFDSFSLDQRNNSSAFIQQINRLGTELSRAKDSIRALRKK